MNPPPTHASQTVPIDDDLVATRLAQATASPRKTPTLLHR